MNDGRKHTLILLSAALIITGIMFLISFFDAPRFNSIETYTITEYKKPTKAVETTTLSSFQSNSLSSPHFQAPKNPKENAAYNDAVCIDGKININTASKEELMSLKSIGEVKAQAIIDYRENNGKFRDITELALVEGISDKIVAENLGRITV